MECGCARSPFSSSSVAKGLFRETGPDFRIQKPDGRGALQRRLGATKSAMIVIPAIDLLDGKAVRLRQGDPARKTVFAHDPVEVARRWHGLGAEWIHVVDLDGSFDGSPRNREVIESIVSGVPAAIQLGGGIRSLKTAETYLGVGVARVVMGTVAAERPELVADACRRWPGRIAVAVDARKGRVAVRGWTRPTDLKAVELAKRCEQQGVSVLIYTDVERDGMSGGLNLEETKRIARSVAIPVIASGGVSKLEDIRLLRDLETDGVMGVIVGRALYEGDIDLCVAIRIARGDDEP